MLAQPVGGEGGPQAVTVVLCKQPREGGYTGKMCFTHLPIHHGVQGTRRRSQHGVQYVAVSVKDNQCGCVHANWVCMRANSACM